MKSKHAYLAEGREEQGRMMNEEVPTRIQKKWFGGNEQINSISQDISIQQRYDGIFDVMNT